MIASTAVLTGATITAAATFESNWVKVDLTSMTTWNYVTLNVQVTNPASTTPPGENLKLNYALTTFASETTGANLKAAAAYQNIQMPATVSGITTVSTGPVPCTGNTLYVWLSHDAWATNRTITVVAAGTGA